MISKIFPEYFMTQVTLRVLVKDFREGSLAGDEKLGILFLQAFI